MPGPFCDLKAFTQALPPALLPFAPLTHPSGLSPTSSSREPSLPPRLGQVAPLGPPAPCFSLTALINHCSLAHQSYHSDRASPITALLPLAYTPLPQCQPVWSKPHESLLQLATSKGLNLIPAQQIAVKLISANFTCPNM